jgi:periplasmic copper chaperone A
LKLVQARFVLAQGRFARAPVGFLLPRARIAALLSLLAAVAALGLAPSFAVAHTPPAVAHRASVAQTAVVAQHALAEQTALVVENAWVRATPGTDIAAAYLTLRNVSATTVTVTGVESPIAGHAMIHETKVEGGQSKMRPHEQLVIAPGATVKLEPGGLHVMLHDLKQPLTVGQTVPLLILLAGGGSVQVTAAVRPLGAE